MATAVCLRWVQSAVGPRLALAVNPGTTRGRQTPQLPGQLEEWVSGTLETKDSGMRGCSRPTQYCYGAHMTATAYVYAFNDQQCARRTANTQLSSPAPCLKAKSDTACTLAPLCSSATTSAQHETGYELTLVDLAHHTFASDSPQLPSPNQGEHLHKPPGLRTLPLAKIAPGNGAPSDNSNPAAVHYRLQAMHLQEAAMPEWVVQLDPRLHRTAPRRRSPRQRAGATCHPPS